MKYTTTWVDLRLPSGQDFAVAVCGYSGLVRHMTFGQDPVRRMSIQGVDVQGNKCQACEHCLALGCTLNHSKTEHLAHMLDMYQDEAIDSNDAELWGTRSTVEALVKFSQKISEDLSEELKRARLLEE